MFTGQGKVVIGYKWVTFGGSQACNACRQMNGREFYLSPGPGQDSTTDMPEPPLHPNCGCKLHEIIDVRVALQDHTDVQAVSSTDQSLDGGRPDANVKDKDTHRDGIIGVRWRNKDYMSGPVYGNFCGLHWSNGKDTRNRNYNSDEITLPLDDLDAACSGHDDSYDMLGTLQSDRNLLKDLEGLSEDPKMWRNPPDLNRINEARMYHKLAIFAFRTKILLQEMEERRKRERQDARDTLEDGFPFSP